MQVQQYVYENYATHANEIKGIFDYINGKVNPHNLCIYNPMYFCHDNFAQFQHPNLVSVFIGSIIEYAFVAKAGGGTGSIRDITLSVAAMVIAHEMTHAEQCIDSFRYKQDPEYRTMIEDSAEYNAEIFCMGHKIAIERKFKFEFVCITKTRQTEFPAWTDAGYVYSTVTGLLRSKDVTNALRELIDDPANKNVALVVQDLREPISQFAIPFKINGAIQYNQDEIQFINERMILLRNGTAAYDFTCEMFTGVVSNPDYMNGIDVPAVILEIKSQLYEPFLFN